MEQEKKQPDVRLIGLDLDGTTLTSEKVLTPHTKEVLEGFRFYRQQEE